MQIDPGGVNVMLRWCNKLPIHLSAVVSEIYKDIVIRSWTQGLARSHVGVDLLSLENLEEDVRADAATYIVLGHPMVHISAIGMVDDLAGCGVLLVVGDI